MQVIFILNLSQVALRQRQETQEMFTAELVSSGYLRHEGQKVIANSKDGTSLIVLRSLHF